MSQRAPKDKKIMRKNQNNNRSLGKAKSVAKIREFTSEKTNIRRSVIDRKKGSVSIHSIDPKTEVSFNTIIY